MITLGVTGGIGAGKSEVLKYLQSRWDAALIRLDDVSRELLEKSREVRELFGPEIVLEDGSLDRQRIAGIIFEDEDKRQRLDGILHPAVKAESIRMLEELKAEGRKIAAVEAALLIEEHYDAICDEMWYIYADEATRYRRLAESRGYDEARIRGTIARQLSEEEFRANTDFVIDNSGDFEETCRQIDGRMRELQFRQIS